MKSIFRIFVFELKNYFTKSYILTMIFSIIIFAVFGSIPSIIQFISSQNGNTQSQVQELKIDGTLLIKNESKLDEDIILEKFSEKFKNYNVELTNLKNDEIENQIREDKIKYAFVIEDESKFSYYVKNRYTNDDLFDSGNKLINEIAKSKYLNENKISQNTITEYNDIKYAGKIFVSGVDYISGYIFTILAPVIIIFLLIFFGPLVSLNIAKQKESRIMEVMFTITKPEYIIIGKVFATTIASVIQVGVLLGSIFIGNLMSSGKIPLEISEMFNIPVDKFLYVILFLILGFLLYMFLFGIVGILADKPESTPQLSQIITLVPSILTVVLVNLISNGMMDTLLVKIASYIPFVSPMFMLARIILGLASNYEVLISCVILLISIILVGIISGRIYRFGIISRGKTFRNFLKTKN